MRPATKTWQKRIDLAILVDAFGRHYGWDYWTVEKQPAWLVDLLPEIWAARAEVRGGGVG